MARNGLHTNLNSEPMKPIPQNELKVKMAKEPFVLGVQCNMVISSQLNYWVGQIVILTSNNDVINCKFERSNRLVPSDGNGKW